MHKVQLEIRPHRTVRSIKRVWLTISKTRNRTVAEHVAQGVRVDHPNAQVRIHEVRA
jgi:hypothetical protein